MKWLEIFFKAGYGGIKLVLEVISNS